MNEYMSVDAFSDLVCMCMDGILFFYTDCCILVVVKFSILSFLYFCAYLFRLHGSLVNCWILFSGTCYCKLDE